MIRHPSHLHLAVAALCTVLAAVTAFGTTVPALDARQLVAQSPSIVHATVLSSQSRWNADRSLIVTESRLRVHDAIKGDPGGEVTVLVPGGTVGKLQVEVPGAVPFAPGTETVVFLVRDAAGNQYVAGASRGRFDVAVDARTGDKTVRGLSGEVRRALAEARGATRDKSAPTAAPLPLDAFLGDLRALVRDVAAKGGR